MQSVIVESGNVRRQHGFSSGTRAVIWACVVGLVLAAAATGLAVQRWRTDLHVFGGVGNLQGGPVALGRTVYAGEYAWPTTGASQVHLTSASAVITTNTADADVDVLLCTISSRARIATIGMTFNTRPYCTSLRAFRPGTFTLRDGKADIVVAVTPHQPGNVHIAGVHLSYSEGFRHGTQDTGINVHTHTPTS